MWLLRDFYLACIKKAREHLQPPPMENHSIDYGHYTFDFAQQLQVPYHARQVGPLFFKVPKVQLFGTCNDSTNTQVNYMYDESQSIGMNGTLAQVYPWEWRAWDKMFDGLFKPVKGIRRYQHFTFCDSQKGNVSVKSTCDGEETTVSILKKGVTIKEVKEAQLPQII